MATRPGPRPRRKLMTADELFELDEWTPEGDKCYELIAGRLIVSEPPGYQHGQVQIKLAILLRRACASCGTSSPASAARPSTRPASPRSRSARTGCWMAAT